MSLLLQAVLWPKRHTDHVEKPVEGQGARPGLIALHDDADNRAAHVALPDLAGLDLGPNAGASAPERQRAIGC